MSTQINQSEKKLTHSFVLWAFLFLIFFETLFLGTRFLIEKKNSENKFLEGTEQLLGRKIDHTNPRGPSFFGIATLKTTPSGEIMFSQNNFSEIQNISDILSEKEIQNLKNHDFIYHEKLLIRRVETNSSVIYFFSRELDILEEFYRDIFRFLLIDIIILIPLYFLIRVHIRRILAPVRENIDTMTHFVHDAGHELKTPIAIISGNLQIMRDSDETEFLLIEESLETIEHMNASIQGLLELADLHLPDKNTKTDLENILKNEIERANNFRNITFENTISEKFPVYASEKHLSILIRNLIENAIKYNKDNGKVFISREKNTLIVRDTGIGMSAENISRIFDRFYRINQNSEVSGSGIGMTLVDKIIKLYNWKIRIESQIDK